MPQIIFNLPYMPNTILPCLLLDSISDANLVALNKITTLFSYGSNPLVSFLDTNTYVFINSVTNDTSISYSSKQILQAYSISKVYTLSYNLESLTNTEIQIRSLIIAPSLSNKTDFSNIPTGATVTIPSILNPTTKMMVNWNTNPDGSGDSYNPGLEYTITADLTLYPIFQTTKSINFIRPNMQQLVDIVSNINLAETNKELLAEGSAHGARYYGSENFFQTSLFSFGKNVLTYNYVYGLTHMYPGYWANYSLNDQGVLSNYFFNIVYTFSDTFNSNWPPTWTPQFVPSTTITTDFNNIVTGTTVTIPSLLTQGEQTIVWNTKPNGSGNFYEPGLEYTITEDLTLYSIISNNPYKLSLDGNGSQSIAIISPIEVNIFCILPDGSSYNYYDSEYNFYTFSHWNTQTDGTGTTYQKYEKYLITSDTILYAIYNKPSQEEKQSNKNTLSDDTLNTIQDTVNSLTYDVPNSNRNDAESSYYTDIATNIGLGSFL